MTSRDSTTTFSWNELKPDTNAGTDAMSNAINAITSTGNIFGDIAKQIRQRENEELNRFIHQNEYDRTQTETERNNLTNNLIGKGNLEVSKQNANTNAEKAYWDKVKILHDIHQYEQSGMLKDLTDAYFHAVHGGLDPNIASRLIFGNTSTGVPVITPLPQQSTGTETNNTSPLVISTTPNDTKVSESNNLTAAGINSNVNTPDTNVDKTILPQIAHYRDVLSNYYKYVSQAKTSESKNQITEALIQKFPALSGKNLNELIANLPDDIKFRKMLVDYGLIKGSPNQLEEAIKLPIKVAEIVHNFDKITKESLNTLIDKLEEQEREFGGFTSWGETGTFNNSLKAFIKGIKTSRALPYNIAAALVHTLSTTPNKKSKFEIASRLSPYAEVLKQYDKDLYQLEQMLENTSGFSFGIQSLLYE